MTAIYQHLLETLKKTDTKHDLEWYASIFGTDAKLGVPEYEVKLEFILCSKIREFLVVHVLTPPLPPVKMLRPHLDLF
jgi:hypothetical protein